MTFAPALDRPVRLARPALSIGMQCTLGILATLVLAGSFLLTGSLIAFAALIGAALLMAICFNPIASIFAIVIANVAIALHGKDNASNVAGAFEIVMGLTLVAILGYWFIRIRLFERKPLSTTAGQLLYSVFIPWAVFVTAVGLFQPHSSLNDAVRELLNLSPLLILPILYSRYVPVDSKIEKWLFVTVLLLGLTMIVWNAFKVKSSIARAYYLFEVGRGNTDQTLGVLLALVGTSMLMSVQGFWKIVFAMLMLALGLAGVVISFGRTLYIAVVVCMIIVLCLGTREEFGRGLRRLCYSVIAFVIALFPLYRSSRLFRLLVLNYFARFLSTQHLGTDLSLVNRYVEWRYEWHAILESPILGRGFGRQFRVYNMIEKFHTWMGFSHSSYLFILNKSGFIGFFLFFGAFISFILKGFHLLRKKNNSSRAQQFLRSFVAFLVAMLIDCYAAPVLDSKTDLIWTALIWGYFLALDRFSKEPNDVPIASKIARPALLGGAA